MRWRMGDCVLSHHECVVCLGLTEQGELSLFFSLQSKYQADVTQLWSLPTGTTMGAKDTVGFQGFCCSATLLHGRNKREGKPNWHVKPGDWT